MFEDIILQLKILGKIQKNGRICKSPDGQGISIEERTTLLWLQRLWNGDSRTDAIDRINKIIRNASEKTKDILKRSCMFQHDTPQDKLDYEKSIIELNTLVEEYKKAQKGIQNLSETYKNDSRTEAKLSLCISRIEEEILTIENRLKSENELESENSE